MDVQVFLLTWSASFSLTKTAGNLKGKPSTLNLTMKYRCTYHFLLGFHFQLNNADCIEYLKAKLSNAIVEILDLRFGCNWTVHLATDIPKENHGTLFTLRKT